MAGSTGEACIEKSSPLLAPLFPEGVVQVNSEGGYSDLLMLNGEYLTNNF